MVFQQDRTSYFLDQSARDSPCRVRLASEDSLFSLSKWNGEAILSFAPGGEHSGQIDVRGNELLLKPEATPKAYHVFRKLDGERFEYDVILLKEPETNVIAIDLAFPDGLEFYRQPTTEEMKRHHIACAPDAIESYAVYWKESNGDYKTGKFCHIYRPLVYDARGRKTWGRLDLSGKRMTITVSEEWLADAQYPVVVDPIIGTQSVGANRQIDWWNESNPDDFYIELGMAVSRYMMSSTPIQGQCRAFLYSYTSGSDLSAQPVAYTDFNGMPSSRASMYETTVNCSVSTPTWVESSFFIYPGFTAYSYIWFGFNTPGVYYTYFDYAGTMYRMNTEGLPAVPVTFAETYGQSWNVRMSAYFEFGIAHSLQRSLSGLSVSAGNASNRRGFGRKCEAGFGLTEAKVLRSELARGLSSVTGVFSVLGKSGLFARLCSSFSAATERVVPVAALCLRLLSGTSVFGAIASTSRNMVLVVMSTLAARTGLNRNALFSRIVIGGIGFYEILSRRVILMKGEMIIVSRITREIEFRGYLV